MDTEETLDVSEETETVDETPVEESDIEEPSLEDESDEETSEEEPSEDNLYAGKYKSVSDLENAYRESNAEATVMAKELKALRQEVDLMKMTPEERQEAQAQQELVQKQGLMTKQEFQQMMRDEQDARDLTSQGATKKQIEKIKRVAQYGEYAKMTLPQIYKDLYGGLPGKAPKRSVKGRGQKRSSGARTISRSDWNALKVGTPEYAKAKKQYYEGNLKIV